VRRLRAEPRRDIYVVGGPTTVGAFLDAGPLDELRLTVHPVIPGGGIELFGRVFAEQWFELVSATPLSAGRIRLVYRRR
jgi:dihydrofolate reductase